MRPCLKRVQPMPNVPLAYVSVCQRMRPCLERIQPMPNVPLAYVSVYRRMSDIFHTLAYASTIRNSVTGPLYFVFISSLNHHARLRTCHHAGIS
jgi:hypothetical protein